ncbi:MAG: hypothetical protein ACKON9_04675, partial [Planctomycetaceae bacterium]
VASREDAKGNAISGQWSGRQAADATAVGMRRHPCRTPGHCRARLALNARCVSVSKNGDRTNCSNPCLPG